MKAMTNNELQGLLLERGGTFRPTDTKAMLQARLDAGPVQNVTVEIPLTCAAISGEEP